MALPSFTHPPFILPNYSHFGSELILDVNNGVTGVGGTPNDPNTHSTISFPFSIYNAHYDNTETRYGYWPPDQIGIMTVYFEFFYDSGNNYANPEDFIRLQIEAVKNGIGEISPSNPIYMTIKVITGQTGIVYTYPTYPVYHPPDANVTIDVGENEGSGDIEISWNDFFWGESFTHVINNYPFEAGKDLFWRQQSRLNIEAWPTVNVIEYTQNLLVENVIVVPSITSEEAHGSFIVEIAQPLIIDLGGVGIPSDEGLGIPRVSVELDHILPLSINSEEAHGSFVVSHTTNVVSGVGTPTPPKRGDISISLNPYVGYGEIELADRDTGREPGLENAVLISIGTNRERNVDDVLPDDSPDKGGWWADEIPVIEGDKIGCRLWLLRRSKSNNDLINDSKAYLQEGLAWMKEDGVASDIFIDTWIVEDHRDTLGMNIGVLRPDIQTVYYKYYYNWEYQILKSV